MDEQPMESDQLDLAEREARREGLFASLEPRPETPAADRRRRLLHLQELAILADNDGEGVTLFLIRPAVRLGGGQTPAEVALSNDCHLDLAIEELSPQLRSVAMKIYDRLCEVWRLSESERCQLIGAVDPAELEQWRTDPSLLPTDTIKRISVLLWIFKNINLLLQSPANADRWIRRPNRVRLTEGRSALELMLVRGLEGMRAVRDYLEAEIWGR
jgi:hypothetical protein